ncbi:tRNA dimethylallyltransferase [Candidatus Daviesbacteria bacterium]|nr:tRNA dimethylallyltransferase [Candidatus Daviesbacteria bacterium]
MLKLLVILGSTSTGKTDLALSLAKKFNGELTSCDSRQLYKRLDIGTGKMPDQFKILNSKFKIEKSDGWWEVNGIRIWMYDVCDAAKQYTVYDFVKDADSVIGDIRERGKLPIVVGGTGLYLKALLEGLPNLACPVDEKLRKELEGLPVEALQERLQKSSFKRWEEMNSSDRQNPRRLIRAIEILLSSLPASPKLQRGERRPACQRLALSGRQGSKKQTSVRNWIPAYAGMTGFNFLKIGLTAPREILYQRIDKRVVDRIDQGMIDEAKRLNDSGLSIKRMRQLGLEYGVLADYLEGKITSQEELMKIMQGKIHGFARRQITWFKKEKDVFWFDITDNMFISKVEDLIVKWYDKGVNYAS